MVLNILTSYPLPPFQAIWLYQGFISLGALSGEVDNPAKTMPWVVVTLMPLLLVLNVMPLAVSWGYDANYTNYVPGHFDELVGFLIGFYCPLFVFYFRTVGWLASFVLGLCALRSLFLLHARSLASTIGTRTKALVLVAYVQLHCFFIWLFGCLLCGAYKYLAPHHTQKGGVASATTLTVLLFTHTPFRCQLSSTPHTALTSPTVYGWLLCLCGDAECCNTSVGTGKNGNLAWVVLFSRFGLRVSYMFAPQNTPTVAILQLCCATPCVRCLANVITCRCRCWQQCTH